MRISDWRSDVCSSDLAVWRAYALLGSVCFGAGADKINGFRAVTARATFLCFSRELFSTASGNTGGRRLEPPLRSSAAAALCVAQPIGQQRVDEGLGVEHAQVFRAFADAGVADRDAELARQRENHAARGAAVELGDHQPGDAGGGMELEP